MAKQPSRKGAGQITECPACGTRVRNGLRKTPHHETEECKALVVQAEYAKRGWAQVSSMKWVMILRECDVPVEMALGGWHEQAYADTDDEGCVTRTWTQQERHEIGFAPTAASKLVGQLTGLRVSPRTRRMVVGGIWDQPDLIEALEAAARLGGLSGKFLSSLALQGLERKGKADFADEQDAGSDDPQDHAPPAASAFSGYSRASRS